MSNEALNKQTVTEYIAAFNAGDSAKLQTLFTPDAVIQGVLGWATLEKALPIWRELHSAFGIILTLDSLVAEGDLVAARYTERGTFNGPFRGHQPTGKSYELVAMEWFELHAGKICRRWGARDSASQARQIGMPFA